MHIFARIVFNMIPESHNGQEGSLMVCLKKQTQLRMTSFEEISIVF